VSHPTVVEAGAGAERLREQLRRVPIAFGVE
jgi:hypothetical protein